MAGSIMGGGGRMSGEFEYGELTRSITGCAMEVHRELGNGFQGYLSEGAGH
ncbi:MAG TPA: hypothetical protein VGS41_10245 [Chthonomonadales bacterium]|nr:hypothetical protein [Chthonomonadales bacterium]